jgi:hypothetical protein
MPGINAITLDQVKSQKVLRPFQFDFTYSKEKFPAQVSAWGTGKSWDLITRALIYAEQIPNNLIYILRREWVDLKDSTIKDFESYTDLTVGSDRNVKFPNGSVIMFRHIEELNRAGKNLQNVNLGAFFIEQAEELPTDREFFILQGRLRRKVEPTEYFKLLGLPDHTGSIVANVAGDNWIKKLWKDHESAGKDRKDFPLIEATTADNAINLPKDFMDTLKLLKENKPEIYKRFVMNDWSAEVEGKVFKRIDDCIAGSFEEPKPGFDYLVGGDYAKTKDFNVIVVMNRQTKHVDYVERWNNTSWNLTKERFIAITTKYNNALLIPDSTGVGDPIVEDLQRDGVRIYHSQKRNSEIETPGVKFNNINKENMVEKLQVAIEQCLISFPNFEPLIEELREFECQMLPSRAYRYTAPVGKNDDCVIALALAVWGLYVYAPDYKEAVPPTKAEDFWKRVANDKKRFERINNISGEREISADEDARVI